jgi:hypothetical protein
MRRPLCAALLSILTLTGLPALSDAARPVLAETGGLVIRDGYARSSGAMARSGAAYLAITNTTDSDDRLIAARSPAAARVALHSTELSDGVARMRASQDGILIPAGETVLLEPGGWHIMLMGLAAGFEQGEHVDVTLVFETAGEVAVDLPVELLRDGGSEDGGSDDGGSDEGGSDDGGSDDGGHDAGH